MDQDWSRPQPVRFRQRPSVAGMNTKLSPELDDTIAAAATGLIWEATRNRGMAPNCCIAACRILQHVLREVGVATRPIAVETSVANAAFLAVAAELGGPPRTEAEADAVARAGGWIVDIGRRGSGSRPSTNRWQGHLVLLTERLLLDPTLPQANRPMKGIALDPFVMVRGGEFPEAPLCAELDDCAVVIVARPRDRSYASAPDWRMTKQHRAIAASTVSALKRLVAEEAAADTSMVVVPA